MPKRRDVHVQQVFRTRGDGELKRRWLAAGQRCRAGGDVVGKERASFPITFWSRSNELEQDQETLDMVSRNGSR